MGKRGQLAVGIIILAILLNSCSPIEPLPLGKGLVDKGPSTVYGKLVDQNNKPIAGEAIVAEWLEEGNLHSVQTTTISKEEAIQLGDEGLEGAFLFSKGEIVAPYGTAITIKTLPRFTSIQVAASPGEAVDAGRMMLLRSTSPPLTKEEMQREQVNVVGVKESISKKIDVRLQKARWWIGTTYFTLLAALVGIIMFRNHKKKGIVAEFVFRKDRDSLETMRIDEIMAKEVITISPDATVQEALELMMHHHINGVVVAESKKVRGILTETDFLRKVHGDLEALKLKVKEVMTSPILTVSSSATVFSVVKLMLKRGIRKIPVVKDEELAGMVSFTDILKLFHGFFKKHLHEKESGLLENVGTCCQKEMIVVGMQESLQDVVKLMKEKNMSYVLVLEGAQPSVQSSLKCEEGMGIITTKDLLDELYKNPHGFEHLKAINVKRTPLLTIDGEKNAAQALDIMEENSIRRIPVRSYNRIVGMLTQPPLLSAIVEYMEKSKSEKKK